MKFKRCEINLSNITLSNILEKAGKTEIGQKLLIPELSHDLCMGVTIADFQSFGNLSIDILLLTSTVSSLPMTSGKVLINLIGSLPQPVASLESSLQIKEITTSSVTVVRSNDGMSNSNI